MRKVMVLKLDKSKPATGGKYQRTDDREAVFHGFGVDYEEFENGPGCFSTAIVEFPDGVIENVYVERVRFITNVDHKIADMAKGGFQLIQCIKIHRAETDSSLKFAKEECERIFRENGR